MRSTYALNTVAARRASKVCQFGIGSTRKEKTAVGKALMVRARAVMNGAADKGDISRDHIDCDNIHDDDDGIFANKLAARREIEVKAVVTRSPPKVNLAG